MRSVGAVAVAVALLGCAGADAGPPGAPLAPVEAGQPVTAPATPATTPPAAATTLAGASGAARPRAPDPAATLPVARPDRSGLALVHVPASPEDLAATIAHAHRRIRAGGDGVAEAGRDLQRALRALARNAGWLDEVDRAMAPDVADAWRSDLAIQRALLANPPRPGSSPPVVLPAWTIRPPLPPEVLRAHYAEAEALTGIGWTWLAAINLVETRMGRIVGVSSAGARGPMQFLPSTWAECCTGNQDDDRDAIIGAATYLAQSGGPADMGAALWQYNPNELYVAMVTAHAEAMAAHPNAYEGFHAYEVIVPTTAGDVRLAEGFSAAEPVDAAAHLAANPQDRASEPKP